MGTIIFRIGSISTGANPIQFIRIFSNEFDMRCFIGDLRCWCVANYDPDTHYSLRTTQNGVVRDFVFDAQNGNFFSRELFGNI